jgi:UTP--glucose-1-phosphate uridylyltransferase
VLTPQVFDVLERTGPGRGGEIQLTDALARLIDTDPADGGGVLGVVFRGRRYDTGDRLDYIKTVVTLACERDDLSGPLLEWLTDFTAGR